MEAGSGVAVERRCSDPAGVRILVLQRRGGQGFTSTLLNGAGRNVGNRRTVLAVGAGLDTSREAFG